MSLFMPLHAGWVKPENMESFELGYEEKKAQASLKHLTAKLLEVGYCARAIDPKHWL